MSKSHIIAIDFKTRLIGSSDPFILNLKSAIRYLNE